MHNPDAIIIGGGHNGLVCACYLARADALDLFTLSVAEMLERWFESEAVKAVRKSVPQGWRPT